MLAALEGLGAPRRAIGTAHHLLRDEVRCVLERADKLGWRWITAVDPDYPPLLEHITDPPFGLFVRGAIPWTHVVAVVGSRRATAYGRQVARWLGEELARAGVVVASGMARGVDAAAHEGALAVGGPTLAVWGTGPDRVYPREHGHLATAIAEHGALLTEYPPGTPPRRHHFPERNRILAGISHGVVVVEAAARSGALITARLAADEGRDVLAVPGSVFSEVSVGPNALIRLGAQPLLTPGDALDLVGVDAVAGAPGAPAVAQGLLELGEEVTVDELAHREGVAVPVMLARLLELEIAGRVERLADGRYSRTTAPTRRRYGRDRP